jgi:hypothetical protein
MSGSPWVAFCPPFLGSAGVRIVALAWCSSELSTYYTVATPRMLFSRRYTLPPSLEGVVGSTFSHAVAVSMFWLALVKTGSYCSMDRLASNADSRWSRSASLTSMVTLSPMSLP